MTTLSDHLTRHRTVTEREAVTILGYRRQTLSNWRSLRRGPPYLKINRSIKYPLTKLLAWRDRHRVTPWDGGME
jgi:hypothetical protein